ncbi:MAG: radical SAM protein [Kiritimatiellae bacterium]|nr:radical SAM protein [Kiritimatiellia bacterium]
MSTAPLSTVIPATPLSDTERSAIRRVAFCYPPIPSDKGTPLLSQNRQFQWFSHPTAIYPVVPASAATLLKARGYEVLWLDGIARAFTPDAFWETLTAWQPDCIFLETKTPVVAFHWQWAAELKRRLPHCRLVMAGDHVTALPEETFKATPVDALLKGGDYDFALLSWLEGRDIPVDLATLPRIDRALTRWQDYAYRNGNFARTPGAYLMSARDCWHGKCTFCSWTTLYPTYRIRPVEDVLDEIGALIQLGVREIMDDAGSLPVGQWLTDFCHGMIARGYHKQVRLDCNLRFGALSAETYRLMRRAGFRLVLFGVESANQATLDKLNKGLTIQAIREGAAAASAAGLDVHITLMFGYPWETREDAERTVQLGREFLRTGVAATLQATWLVPYPGTPLYRELEASGQLLTQDWSRYDMRSPVMRSPLSENDIRACIAATYRGFLHPFAILRQLRRALGHPAYLFRGAAALIGHLRDFVQRSPEK